MEQQITDQICLLFLSSPGDETAVVDAALAQHPAITVLPCENHESLANVLTQNTIDAVCLTTNGTGIHGSNTEAWIAQLKRLDGRLPVIMLAPSVTCTFTADLMATTRVIVLSKVKAQALEDEVWLQVADEGIGIPAVESQHIFERFYQIDRTTSRKYGGMGLGLAIVKEIVTAHQGRVWAESQGEGQGTALTIALPIHKPEVRL
jgi:light-regulated signal transduction histidine kinase (bacteriophytochrome)